MSQVLNCADARMLFALLLYGELSFDEEERVDTHLDGCAECRAALERETSLHAAFDGVAVEPAASLLRECRADLTAAIHLEHAQAQRPLPAHSSRAGWWERFASMLGGASILRPVGAVALVALGFLGARLTPLFSERFGKTSSREPPKPESRGRATSRRRATAA